MLKLNKRRNAILSFIQNNQPVSTSQIGRYLTHDWEETVSRATIIRDINELLRVKAIKRQGAGRGARYSESLENTLLKHIDINGYFAGWAKFDSVGNDCTGTWDSIAVQYQPLWRSVDSSAWEVLGSYRYADLSLDGDTWVTWATSWDTEYQIRFLDIPSSAEAIYLRPTGTSLDSGVFIAEILIGIR